MGADHEETVAGLEVGIAGGQDGALAAALDAADEDADLAQGGQFGEGAIRVGTAVGDRNAFAGEVGEGDCVLGGTDAGGEVTFGDGQLIGGTEQEESISGIKGFVAAGIHPGIAIAIEGEDGATGSLTETEIADASAGDVGLEWEGDLGDFEVPVAGLIEDGQGDAGGHGGV